MLTTMEMQCNHNGSTSCDIWPSQHEQRGHICNRDVVYHPTRCSYTLNLVGRAKNTFACNVNVHYSDTMDSVKQSAALCLLRLYKTSPDLVMMGEWTSRVVHLLNDQHMVRTPRMNWSIWNSENNFVFHCVNTTSTVLKNDIFKIVFFELLQ